MMTIICNLMTSFGQKHKGLFLEPYTTLQKLITGLQLTETYRFLLHRGMCIIWVARFN